MARIGRDEAGRHALVPFGARTSPLSEQHFSFSFLCVFENKRLLACAALINIMLCMHAVNHFTVHKVYF